MVSPSKGPGIVKSQIVVGVDGSAAGYAALEWAVRQAAHSRLRLNLVRVVPGSWSFRNASRYHQSVEQARELLTRKAQLATALDTSLQVTTTLLTGETVRALRVLSRDAEMIVVGTDRRPDRHGEGFGSVRFQTAVTSRCDVTVVPAAGATDRAGVVVGTDGSTDADIAVQRAVVEAIRRGTAEEDLGVACDCGWWPGHAAHWGQRVRAEGTDMTPLSQRTLWIRLGALPGRTPH